MDAPPPLERFARGSDTANTEEPNQRNPSSAARKSSSAFRRGFLNGPVSSNKRPILATACSTSQEAPLLVFPEVQEAVGRGWITADLVERIATDAVLSKALSSRDFQDLIELMKTDPARAKSVLGSQPELASAFQAWAKLMGDHFEALGNRSDQAESTLIQEARPENRADIHEVLKDREVGNRLEYIRRGGKLDPRQLASVNPALASKIQTLLNSGHLSLTV